MLFSHAVDELHGDHVGVVGLRELLAAPSSAPLNRSPMVSRPEASEETRSLPAREAMMVLCAPETAGPWSAVTIRHISRNLQAYEGNLKVYAGRSVKLQCLAMRIIVGNMIVEVHVHYGSGLNIHSRLNCQTAVQEQQIIHVHVHVAIRL